MAVLSFAQTPSATATLSFILERAATATLSIIHILERAGFAKDKNIFFLFLFVFAFCFSGPSVNQHAKADPLVLFLLFVPQGLMITNSKSKM